LLDGLLLANTVAGATASKRGSGNQLLPSHSGTASFHASVVEVCWRKFFLYADAALTKAQRELEGNLTQAREEVQELIEQREDLQERAQLFQVCLF
jgi:hypothetical protein